MNDSQKFLFMESHVLRIWFASHREPVTIIPEIYLGELETDIFIEYW